MHYWSDKSKKGDWKVPFSEITTYFCIGLKNKQITSAQRYTIQALLQENTAVCRIAELLDTHKSSIYRELKRNKTKRGGYNHGLAQELCNERKERFGRVRKFTSVVEKRVKAHLEHEQWSPKQIVGHCRLKGIEMVSYERIYQYIRQDKQNGGLLWTHTRHKLKHRKRPVPGKLIGIKNRVSIDERPAIVEAKERYGDWEIDTIIGKDQQGAIVTITERKTGFLLMRKLPQGKQAQPLALVVVQLLLAYKNTVHTITSDNGNEFAAHEHMAKKLNAKFYFAHPYSSWERGLNEYTNKLIRQYIIKGTSFDLYTDEYILLVQNRINRRPREKLGFQTPSKIFFASLN